MDFASLYRQYAGDVFRFAYFLSGNHALAEDIAAETFARALTAGDRIQTGTVKAYLLRIARNLFVDAVRRDTRLENLTGSEEQISDPAPNPEAVTRSRMELEFTWHALATLSEGERSALLMSAVTGLSHEQIAVALDCSVPAVKLRIHRARLRLRQLTARGSTSS
jgi:RNA polymerase sigma-70 factor (ECF subfamily)